MSKRIRWTYRHSRNAVATTPITKQGEYFGRVKHTYKHWRRVGAVQMAWVKFDDNKRYSCVPFDELVFEKKEAGNG